jgi:two-component system phosphate regulon response regulator PhoB
MDRQKVLIVSADGLQAKFILDCLVEAGYEAWVVELEDNAIAMIQQVIPDLVILNWGLQPERGLQLIRTIREADQAESLPILVSGVEMQEQEVLSSLEAGADISLRESFHPRVFLARVNSILKRAHHVQPPGPAGR